MNWDDIGFLVSKNRYNENSIISEIFTKNHGKISGLIFGATSKKIKNYLQIGNLIHVNYNSKSENKIGYFKIEIQKAFSPFYFEDRQKLACITSAMTLVKILTAEAQKNSDIYDLLIKFYKILNTENWIKNYIFWELDLFKNLGYDLRFKDLVVKQNINNQISYISRSSSEKKIVPNFLIEINHEIETKDNLINGLNLIGDYLDKSILKPNSLSHPISRQQFISSLK